MNLMLDEIDIFDEVVGFRFHFWPISLMKSLGFIAGSPYCNARKNRTGHGQTSSARKSIKETCLEHCVEAASVE